MKTSAALPRISLLATRRVSRLAFFCLLPALATFVLPSNAGAQSSTAVLPRITAKVDNTQLVTLKGNTPTMAQAQFDQGAMSDSTPAPHIQIVLKRSAA
jgi:hypothetical protein